MTKKVLTYFIGVLVLAGVAAAVYFYYGLIPAPGPSSTVLPPAQPDNSVIAGPVKAVSDTSVTVQKQDGTTATLSIASTTQITLAGHNGQAPVVKKAADLRAGLMVLIVPNPADAAAAWSVVIVPPPPVQ